MRYVPVPYCAGDDDGAHEACVCVLDLVRVAVVHPHHLRDECLGFIGF